MSPESFYDGRVVLHGGDCLSVLASMPSESVDSIVTDPPYHLASIVKRFGKSLSSDIAQSGAASAGKTGVYKRSSKGFMGQTWDGGEIAHRPETWAAILRVLKPGGHCVAFHASKNWARQAVAMEDGGFEMRDTIIDLFDADGLAADFITGLSPEQSEMFAHLLANHDGLADLFWMYGTGFPKSVNIANSIDKRMGAEGEVLRERYTARRLKPGATVVAEGGYSKQDVRFTAVDRAPATADALRFLGFGTALKPAFEPICLARKPLEAGGIVDQVLATGTGAINVAGCLVGYEGGTKTTVGIPRAQVNTYVIDTGIGGNTQYTGKGRWPANITHDGSAAVQAAFPTTGPTPGSYESVNRKTSIVYGGGFSGTFRNGHKDDGGSAARFFYSAKANADDRIGSRHPTVKPVDLMRWLVRLVTPPGGVILDPFAGTGTTGEAALLEGFSAILIERESDYRADIARRMACVFEGASARAKAKASGAPVAAAMPLFDQPVEGGADGFTGASPTKPLHRANRNEALT